MSIYKIYGTLERIQGQSLFGVTPEKTNIQNTSVQIKSIQNVLSSLIFAKMKRADTAQVFKLRAVSVLVVYASSREDKTF